MSINIKEALYEGRLALSHTEAETLLSFVLKKEIIELYKGDDYELREDEKEKYRTLVNKRKTQYPLEYLIGNTEFMGIPFIITEDVLIPRQETEILTEVVIKEAERIKNPRIIDIGCGSGVIAICVKRYVPSSFVVGTDISEKAILVAYKNARLNNTNISFICCDLLNAIKGRFDIIVSNPPYVEEALVLAYEPRIALAGGEDGLSFYPRIFEQAKGLLDKGGLIILEIGYSKTKAILEIAKTFSLSLRSIIKDYAGIDRVLVF